MSVLYNRPMKLSFRTYEPVEKFNLDNILMIHGMTSSKETWNNVAKTIADKTHRTIYTLDMRNHGDNEWSDTFDYTSMANDVMHFMEERNIKNAVIIGHSMGGKVAMTLALIAPEKVGKLVIEEASPKPLTSTIQKVAISYVDLLMDNIQLIPANVDYETAQKFITDFFSKHFSKERIEKMDFSSLITKNNNGRFISKVNLPVIRKFLTENIVSVPTGTSFKKSTLMVYGASSNYKIIQDKEYILKFFPKAVFQAVEGASHFVHSEFPEEFSSYVIEFLNNS